MYVVAGVYFVFFFMISHHFDGAQTLTNTSRQSNRGGKENSFLYKQVPMKIGQVFHLTMKFTSKGCYFIKCWWLVALPTEWGTQLSDWASFIP